MQTWECQVGQSPGKVVRCCLESCITSKTHLGPEINPRKARWGGCPQPRGRDEGQHTHAKNFSL